MPESDHYQNFIEVDIIGFFVYY